MVIAFAAGLGGGLVVALLAKLVEQSRLAIGPYAFYGNGALIVPPVGAAVALYALWTWQLVSGRPRRELALSGLGVYLGVGFVAFPSLPALLFTGAIFVLPVALLVVPFIYLGVRVTSRAQRIALGAALPALLLFVVLGLPLLASR